MTNPFESNVDSSYNPFDMGNSLEQTQEEKNFYDDAPLQQSYTYEKPNIYQTNSSTTGAQMKDSITGLSISEAELARREEALARREQELASKENLLEQARANGTTVNPFTYNYPPYLKWYKYYPESQLPSDSIGLQTKIRWLIYALFVNVILNFIGCMFCFVSPIAVKCSSPSAFAIFGTVFIFVPFVAFDMVLMVQYNALKESKGLKYIGFLITYAILIIFQCYLALGIGNYGSIGWVNAIDFFQAKGAKWVPVYDLIVAIYGTLVLVGMCWTYWLSIVYYRKTGLEKKAYGEAAVVAADYAKDHKDDIVDYARENPGAIAGAARVAATYT